MAAARGAWFFYGRGQRLDPRIAKGGIAVGPTKRQVCMICAKPSTKTICEACSEKLRGEALHKKKKEEKIKE